MQNFEIMIYFYVITNIIIEFSKPVVVVVFVFFVLGSLWRRVKTTLRKAKDLFCHLGEELKNRN